MADAAGLLCWPAILYDFIVPPAMDFVAPDETLLILSRQAEDEASQNAIWAIEKNLPLLVPASRLRSLNLRDISRRHRRANDFLPLPRRRHIRETARFSIVPAEGCSRAKVPMTISETATLILRRCKAMNCVHEGQSFSTGVFHSELGGRAPTAEAIEAMVAARLGGLGANGTVVLTGTGASAISALLPEKRRGHVKTGAWQPRRTVNPPS